MPEITQKTGVSLTVVCIIATACIAWGVLTAKVMSIEEDIVEVKSELTLIRNILIEKNLTLNK